MTDRVVRGNPYHGVHERAQIVSSKGTTEFTDHQMPERYPDLPVATRRLASMPGCAGHFDPRPHIPFGTAVTIVTPCADGRWDVALSTGERLAYKGVLVCNGHHRDRGRPQLPGTLAGELSHFREYRRVDQLRDTRVLAIGGGHSACDAASEGARVASSAGIASRRLLPAGHRVATDRFLNAARPRHEFARLVAAGQGRERGRGA